MKSFSEPGEEEEEERGAQEKRYRRRRKGGELRGGKGEAYRSEEAAPGLDMVMGWRLFSTTHRKLTSHEPVGQLKDRGVSLTTHRVKFE